MGPIAQMLGGMVAGWKGDDRERRTDAVELLAPLKDATFVVFDTETSGMPPGGRLVEIGAIRVRGGHVVDRYQRLVFPEGPIPEQVIAIKDRGFSHLAFGPGGGTGRPGAGARWSFGASRPGRSVQAGFAHLGRDLVGHVARRVGVF